MLDVSPPGHPAHSWSDFFIHMGTICLGLLIALGLEQIVEHMNRRHEVRESLHTLDRERTLNERRYKADTAVFFANAEMLRNDLMVLAFLKQHPGTSDDKLPGVLRFFGEPYTFPDASAWQAAKQASLVQYFPDGKASDLTTEYSLLQRIPDTASALWQTIDAAMHYTYVDPRLGVLSPAEVDEEIGLIEKCIDANLQYGLVLENVGSIPGFSGGPTLEQVLGTIRSIQDPPTEQELATPRGLTQQRLTPSITKARKALEAAEHE